MSPSKKPLDHRSDAALFALVSGHGKTRPAAARRARGVHVHSLRDDAQGRAAGHAKRVRLPRACVFLGLLSMLAACAGPPAPKSQRPSLITQGEAMKRFDSPAEWRYHPRAAAPLVARLSLSKNDLLLAGAKGERWLYRSKDKTALAASALAQETLVSVLRLSDSRWVFVGESGTGYESESPLGEFVRASAPVDPLHKVSARGTAIAGVRSDGALIQSSNAGITWSRVPQEREFFADVAWGADGVGVAFSVPEAWFATEDHGQQWKRLDVSPIGVVELRTDVAGSIVALGATSWFEVDPKGTPVFRERSGVKLEEEYKLPVSPPRGPDAFALSERRALLMNHQYFEVVPTPDTEHKWALASGALGQAIREEPLAFAKDCRSLRIAGFEKTLYVACFKSDDESAAVPIKLYKSGDLGKSFKREPFTLRAKFQDFRMAVGAGSRVIVSGICSPQDSSRGCAPHGVYHKRRTSPADEGSDAQTDSRAPAAKFELALSAVPGLAETPMAMTFSADGRVAYLVGQRTKSDNYTMFVSLDHGETFRAREVEQLSSKRSSSRHTPWYQRRKSADTVLDMQAAYDGTLSVVIRRGERLALAVTDDDGRVLSLTPGPGESTTLGAFGTRAVAIAPESGKAWETLDGGVSWQPLGSTPVALCEKDRECDVPVRCGLGGCVVGNQLTRVGWGGQAEAQPVSFGPPQDLTSGLLYPHVKTPIGCTLADEEWALMEGVKEPPSAHEAAIKQSAWHLHGSDVDTAAVWAYHATLGKRDKVRRETLFPPAATPQLTAFAVFDQIEGAAALRYRVPRPGTGEHELTQVEVAWDNRFEGVVKRASLPRRLPFRSGDYSSQKAVTQLARPDIVSIGVGGVYLRPHHHLADGQVTYFLDGRQVDEIPPVEWPSSPLAGRSEMVHAHPSHLPIRVQARGAALTRANWQGQGWEFASVTIGLPEPKEFEMAQQTGITYFNGASTFYVLSSAGSGSPRRGLAFPIQGSGPVSAAPIELPAQLDLSDPPSPCGDTQRSGTPRVVAPFQAGTRHPVVITHRIEPIRTLMSVDAVMHGTPGEPCVEALSAVPVDMDEREDRVWMYALIYPSDMTNAWAFRVVYDEEGDKTVYSRRMSCEFDPKALVPKKVYSEPGTLSSQP